MILDELPQNYKKIFDDQESVYSQNRYLIAAKRSLVPQPKPKKSLKAGTFRCPSWHTLGLSLALSG